MVKLLFVTFFSFAALFFGNEKLKEENLITLQPDSKALLVTHNGCWDINHFIINRGDSILNIPATIGNDVYGYSLHDTVAWSDTLPTNYLIDFCITEPYSQTTWWNSWTRYFFTATSSYIYQYSLYTSFISFPLDINRLDSLPTPAGFITMVMSDYDSSLLVVNREPDSVSYKYSFYSMPSLSLDTQIIFKLKPDIISLSMY